MHELVLASVSEIKRADATVVVLPAPMALSESGATAALQQLNSKQCPVAVVATAARHASAAKCGGRSSVVGDIFQTLQHRGDNHGEEEVLPRQGAYNQEHDHV
jgi:hypothetical protein